MSEDWLTVQDLYRDRPIESWMTILRCPHDPPEDCPESWGHMEHQDDDVPHHYGCDCGSCQGEYWAMKN